MPSPDTASHSWRKVPTSTREQHQAVDGFVVANGEHAVDVVRRLVAAAATRRASAVGCSPLAQSGPARNQSWTAGMVLFASAPVTWGALGVVL